VEPRQRRGCESGGIAALARLLVGYCATIEADLLREYRVDLRRLGRGLSYRRLGVLIEGLPSDSAFGRALARDAPPVEMTEEDEARAWRLEHHLLALVADLLSAANWQRGGGQGSRPKPIRRPGVKDDSVQRIGAKESPLTPEQKREILQRIGPPREEESQ